MRFSSLCSSYLVCILTKSLYVLTLAVASSFYKFNSYFQSLGFTCMWPNSSIFVLHTSIVLLVLLIYVDDVITIASSSNLVLILSYPFIVSSSPHEWPWRPSLLSRGRSCVGIWWSFPFSRYAHSWSPHKIHYTHLQYLVPNLSPLLIASTLDFHERLRCLWWISCSVPLSSA